MSNTVSALFAQLRLPRPHLLICALATAILPSIVLAEMFSPMTAEYSVSLGSNHLGKGRIALYERAEDCFEYTYEVKPRMAIRWLVGNVDERSQFCVVDGKIRPSRYQFEGRIKSNYTLEFDWENAQVTANGKQPRKIRDNALDRLAMHMGVRMNTYGIGDELPTEPFSFDIVEEKRIKTYEFRVTGRERISNDAGSFDTIKVERVNDPKKKSIFWIAPELDYALVKFFQQRKDDPEIVVNLTKAPRIGQPVDWDKEDEPEPRRYGPR